MKDDYLWDKTGQPDPEVDRLEKLLGRYRWRERPADFSAAPVALPQPAHWRWLAAAAAVVLVAGIGAWLALRPETSAWEVVRVEGMPQMGASGVEEKARLRANEWLETDAGSRARLESLIGEVEVEPNTRLRLRRAQLSEHRLEMRHGTIHARIWAPPRLFFVETPSATAIDLGCSYTLEVADDGAGRLEVTSGWVAFELDGRESFIPAGAQCQTRPGVGPGTPCFTDAAEKFKAGLEQLDFGALTPDQRAATLKTVLAEARPRDAFSLWHLLARVNSYERAAVYDRLAQLSPPPAGVTREGVLGGDRRMLDLWWDSLGYGDANWFRFWKQNLPERAP